MHLGARYVRQRVLGHGSVGIIGLLRKVVTDQRENAACRSLRGERAALGPGAWLCRVESSCYIVSYEGCGEDFRSPLQFSWRMVTAVCPGPAWRSRRRLRWPWSVSLVRRVWRGCRADRGGDEAGLEGLSGVSGAGISGTLELFGQTGGRSRLGYLLSLGGVWGCGRQPLERLCPACTGAVPEAGGTPFSFTSLAQWSSARPSLHTWWGSCFPWYKPWVGCLCLVKGSVPWVLSFGRDGGGGSQLARSRLCCFSLGGVWGCGRQSLERPCPACTGSVAAAGGAPVPFFQSLPVVFCTSGSPCLSV